MLQGTGVTPSCVGQPSSNLLLPQPAIETTFAVSLYLHVSLFFGIAKLGLTTAAGGPRENGHHAKVYFPATHKAAFRIQLRCPTPHEAARQIRRYEALAFSILSSFILCGEVRCAAQSSRQHLLLPSCPSALLSFAARRSSSSSSSKRATKMRMRSACCCFSGACSAM